MALLPGLAESFDILGVKPGDNPARIRSAFRRLALSCHPDVASSKQAVAFERIVTAYALLRKTSPEEMEEVFRAHGEKDKGRPRSPFRRKKREGERPFRGEKPDDSLRVRELLLEKTLVEAEIIVTRLSSRPERDGKNEERATLRLRLLGSLPGVRLLALASLGKRAADKEFFDVLIEMARRWSSDDETVEGLLLQDLGEDQKALLAGVLCSNASLLSEKTALEVLRRIRRFSKENDFLAKMLFHPSSAVLSRALGAWHDPALPGDLTLVRLMKREEEEVLVPLLRILRTRGAPPWVRERIKILSSGHPAAAVRVWAGSIVRAENLV